ncbi:MAG: oligoendopeptidase F [Synergistaceae bacterium]|jgi:oligoendopeptidase F|nr:oligoendopeptidase F [Synergistaceae bacterium]
MSAASDVMLSGEISPRSEIPDGFKWKLSDIYAAEADWESDFARVKAMIPKLSAMRGGLGKSASNLLSCLRLRDEISMVSEKIYVYATMKSHENTADPAAQNLAARAQTLITEMSGDASFVTPEIIGIPDEVLSDFTDPARTGADFDEYRFMFREIARSHAHILPRAEEELLARAGEMASVSDSAFSMLTDADMRFGFIRGEDGREEELTEERYMKHISSRDRSVRLSAFTALYETYRKYNNTIGATFNGMLKASRFFSNARKYGSDIERALDGANIPIAVYDNLIETVEANLGHLHRYMALRKKVLGLDELRMYDIYNPLVENPYRDIPWETAKKMTMEALRPLGEEYMARLGRGLGAGWVDVYPNRGKRGGAYSWGAYGTHPYILLNYNGELSDVMTLVHELGHSMHSFYSRSVQPYPTSDYTIFCAEVASTANEELALDYLLRTADDRNKKIYLLNQRLERIRATVYRQTMFASFERAVHARSQAGEDTTAFALGKMWFALNEKYFGSDMTIDELISYEWSRIPHFYSPFYVYQYATGYSAAAALSARIISEGEPAVRRYVEFLSSGGSDYSIELLKRAGVDMSEPEPVKSALELFGATLDEMEISLKEAEILC